MIQDRKLYEVLLDDLPENGQCLYCYNHIDCVRGYTPSPYSIYVHECKACGAVYVRIFYDYSRNSRDEAMLSRKNDDSDDGHTVFTWSQ